MLNAQRKERELRLLLVLDVRFIRHGTAVHWLHYGRCVGIHGRQRVTQELFQSTHRVVSNFYRDMDSRNGAWLLARDSKANTGMVESKMNRLPQHALESTGVLVFLSDSHTLTRQPSTVIR